MPRFGAFFMINLNGNIVENNQVLTPSNRAFAYGDGVFETLKIVSGKILFWEDHYLRLMASMRIMRMEIPQSFTMDYLEKQILDTAQAHLPESKSTKARITVFRNEGGLYTPVDNSVSFVITAAPLDTPFYLFSTEKYEIELFKDYQINSGLLSTIKTTSKAIHTLAGIFAQENDFDNCILLNENKMVVEAINGNIFLVFGNTIKTPPISDGCLRGVMRKQLLNLAKQIPDYMFEETTISPFDLQKADEVFITNVITGIQPVTLYRKKQYQTTAAKNLLTKLNVKIRLG